MKKIFVAAAIFLFVVEACGSPTTAPTTPPTITSTTSSIRATPTPAEDTVTRLEELGGVPCPDSDFTCVTLSVPLNHFDPQDIRTIDVVFGVLPATGRRKGVFVTATGGPGTAGLMSADDYTAAFDRSIPEHFDIVFFDQRGVGQSGGLQCKQAAADFYLADWDGKTVPGEAALVEAAQTFADVCIGEMGNPDILQYLGTDQAVEDLEAFRAAMGEERLWLYGESYGTQYAQTFAAAHPEALAGLILDGTVDLTLSGPDFYVEQARAFSNVFISTLKACNEDELCAESMGGEDAIAVYRKLIENLKHFPDDCSNCAAIQSPLPFEFPLPSGGSIQRFFTFADLETAASSYLYSESERMIFLRSLAAYARNGDLVPLARVFYNSLALDPETLAAIPDPSYSAAIFYAVECQDYSYFSGTPDERAQAFLRAGDQIEAGIPHFSSIFYSDMPCLFWPNARAKDTRPVPLIADGISTLVLGATADPATPVSNGQAVFGRLADGYLITQEGGPHVIYGRGVSCIDDLVTDFLVNDQLPVERQTECAGTVTREFVPLAPLNASEFEDPLKALKSLDNEIYYLPEYYYWDVVTPTSVGCPFGGILSFEATDTGDSLKLDNCAFSEGFAVSGNGSNNYDDGSFALEVDVSGLKNGALTYTRDGGGMLHAAGTYAGEDIDLSE